MGAQLRPLRILSARTAWLSVQRSLSQSALFAALVVIGFCNGISEKVYNSISSQGFLDATFQTFDVSIILWGACAAAIFMLFKDRPDQMPTRRDYGVAILASICFLLPVPALGWIGLVFIAMHLYLSDRKPATRRAAIVIFVLTVPLFWSRLLFASFTDSILRLDAHLVAWMVGTTPSRNVVPFADGSGFLFLAPACSSVANLSLALLSATALLQLRSARWTPATIFWTVVSAAAVIAINVARISLMAFYPAEYDLIHGPVGASIAGWLTLAAIVLVGYHRIGRDARHGA